MTIRAKLYAAIVLTVLGPLATTAVALNGIRRWATASTRCGKRSQHEALARELKFQVTDMNGGRPPTATPAAPCRRGSRLGRRAPAELEAAPKDVHRRARGRALNEQQGDFAFMELDAVAWHALQARQTRRASNGSCSVPSCGRFETMADTAGRARHHEEQQATATTENSFNHARDDARKRTWSPSRSGPRRDHPAARHRKRHRENGTRGRAPRVGGTSPNPRAKAP